jgi:hypothetical protein
MVVSDWASATCIVVVFGARLTTFRTVTRTVVPEA